MNILKKVFTMGVVMTTVVWAMGAAALVPVAEAVTLSAGDLIKGSGTAVYYYAADGQRYTFPTQSTYMTWYNDFSTVKTITDNELAAISLAGNVVVRPGTNLVKITTVPKVFAVESNGMLRHVDSESAAATLYGANWASRVIDIPDGFWPNYTDLNEALDGTEYPEGQLVKMAGSPDVYYVNDNGSWSKIANESAFYANRWDFKWVVTAPSSMSFTAGANVTEANCDYYDVSQGGGCGAVMPVTGGPLTVALSGDTPAGMTIPTDSPTTFTIFDFWAGSDAVTINSLTLQAGGLSNAENIDAVTLYWNGAKVSNSKDVSASSKEATFNFSTPLTLNANAHGELEVRATASDAGVYALGIQSAGKIITNASSVSGSFPLMGNSHQAAANSNIGTVGLNNVDNSATTNDFGEDDVLVASFDLTANNEDVLWQHASLRNGGTNTDGIIDNCRMLIDGVEEATGTYMPNYVDFTINNYMIEENDTVGVEVRCDLGVANVGNEIKLYIEDREDFVFLGQNFGFGVQLTTAGFENLDSSTEGITVTLAAGQVTQDMDKAATPSKDVKPDTNDVVLATWSIVSNGENATLQNITHADAAGSQFQIDGTGLETGEIENVEMRDVDTGAIYDITATWDGGDGWFELTLDDEIGLTQGVQRTFEIRADLQGPNDAAPIDDGDQLAVTVEGGALNITGDTSSASLTDITPSSVVSSITTVRAASLDWTTTPLTDVTLVPGATDQVVYQAVLEAGSSDDVKLQAFTLSTDAINGGDLLFDDGNISKLDVYLDGVLVKSISNQIVEGNEATVTFNSLTTTGDANVIPADTAVNLVVRASFAGSFDLTLDDGAGNDNTFSLEVDAAGDVTARAKSDNASITGGALTVDTGTNSRAVTLAASGNLSVELKTDDLLSDEAYYQRAGASTPVGKYLAELEFTTVNEPVKVTRLSLTNDGDTTNADLSTVNLVEADGTVVASAVVNSGGDAIFDPFDYVFPADETTSLYVSAATKGINVDGDPSSSATHARTIEFSITDEVTDPLAVVAEGADSGEAIAMAEDAGGGLALGEWSANTVDSNTHTLTAVALLDVTNEMNDGVLTGGANKMVAKYKFSWDTGSNRNASNQAAKAELGEVVLTFNKSAAVVVANVEAYIEGTSTKVAADTEATLTAGNTTGTATWNNATLAGLAGSGEMSGDVVLVIEADVTTTSSEFLQTSFADLDGAGNDDDIQYDGFNNGVDADFVNMFLGYTDLSGATLAN